VSLVHNVLLVRSSTFEEAGHQSGCGLWLFLAIASFFDQIALTVTDRQLLYRAPLNCKSSRPGFDLSLHSLCFDHWHGLGERFAGRLLI